MSKITVVPQGVQSITVADEDKQIRIYRRRTMDVLPDEVIFHVTKRGAGVAEIRLTDQDAIALAAAIDTMVHDVPRHKVV